MRPLKKLFLTQNLTNQKLNFHKLSTETMRVNSKEFVKEGFFRDLLIQMHLFVFKRDICLKS